LAVFFIHAMMQTPRDDRNWVFDLTEKVQVEAHSENQYSLTNIRAFEYDLNGLERQERIARSVNVDQLVESWFFLEPFPDSDLFGHTYLSFVFENEAGETDVISISVEARREDAEGYSPFLGIFRRYELLYAWSTEKDVHSRIAIHLDHPVYAYKLELTPEQQKLILQHFIERTRQLEKTPRFYNTLWSNCTNELAKAVNDAYPGSLPWSPAWVTTGRSPKWLFERGFVQNEYLSFDAYTARADIRPAIKAAISEEGPAFSHQWRNKFTAQIKQSN